MYLRWLRIADLLVCLQTIIQRLQVYLTLLSAHLEYYLVVVSAAVLLITAVYRYTAVVDLDMDLDLLQLC